VKLGLYDWSNGFTALSQIEGSVELVEADSEFIVLRQTVSVAESSKAQVAGAPYAGQAVFGNDIWQSGNGPRRASTTNTIRVSKEGLREEAAVESSAPAAIQRWSWEPPVKLETPPQRNGIQDVQIPPTYGVRWEGDASTSPSGDYGAALSVLERQEVKESPPIQDRVALTIILANGDRHHVFFSDELSLEEAPSWLDDAHVRVVRRTALTTEILLVDIRNGKSAIEFQSSSYLSRLSWSADRSTFAANEEQPSRPPRLVITNMHGQSRAVAEPNLNIQTKHFPSSRVRRIVNKYGHEMFVRITFPKGFKRGTRYPLVATSYVSRPEFQRGGTGNECPIYQLANEGMFVLALHVYPTNLTYSGRGNLDASWVRTLSPLATLEEVVAILVEDGHVDPNRCGLTGLSYGSEIVETALLHSTAFQVVATAAIGIRDPSTYYLHADQWRELMQKSGLPPPTEDLEKWREVSIALNAQRIKTPILVQASDAEARHCMESFIALRESGCPVDLIIYDDEAHEKARPLSKAFVYERTLNWMMLWLLGRNGSGPAWNLDQARWTRLYSMRRDSSLAQ
jgi:dipeptidyl aminopeptidase/acylaminoacyl peptidase